MSSLGYTDRLTRVILKREVLGHWRSCFLQFLQSWGPGTPDDSSFTLWPTELLPGQLSNISQLQRVLTFLSWQQKPQRTTIEGDISDMVKGQLEGRSVCLPGLHLSEVEPGGAHLCPASSEIPPSLEQPWWWSLFPVLGVLLWISTDHSMFHPGPTSASFVSLMWK